MKKVFIGFVVLVALAGILILAGFALPGEVRVSRSAVIEAPADAVHPWVSDLEKWPEWTAWNATTYPQMKYTYEGPESGVGAVSKWTDPSGDGRLEITASDETKGIEYKLWFDTQKNPDPTPGRIDYEPAGSGTRVTWSFVFVAGNNPLARWFGLMIDSMVGSDFEKGLAGLKQKVEAKP